MTETLELVVEVVIEFTARMLMLIPMEFQELVGEIRDYMIPIMGLLHLIVNRVLILVALIALVLLPPNVLFALAGDS